ncbi:MAG: D-alanine--D-alanine ligase [Gammaproteobacteria bacterium]|nr:D-alanine--D-alanine ligase [Gammaproteobacteria bacterium]
MNAAEFGKVAVLMGGLSAEREVSLKSGQAVLDALRRKQVDAHGIDVDKNIIKILLDGGFDRVFNVLHGRGGEDGVMQGVLEKLGLPFTGSDVLGSALSMDKLRTKQIWISQGIPTPLFKIMNESTNFDDVCNELGLPLIVKPNHEGSSVGMSKVVQAADLSAAYKLACKYDAEVIAEQWIDGDEYTATILGDDPLPLIRLETPREFYDYAAKYSATDTSYHCPSGLQQQTEEELKQLALTAFHSIGASGWGRVDFMCDTKNNPWFIEVNTIPGMTDHSLVPKAASEAGLDFDELVWRILSFTNNTDNKL